MTYTPQAPPTSPDTGTARPPRAGSTTSAKPVIPVMAVTEFLDMTVEEFSRWDRAVEVAVPWLSETLWFVPRLDHVRFLVADGIRRGRIWTAGELADLLSIPAISRSDIQNIGRLKVAFGAQILSAVPETGDNAASIKTTAFKTRSNHD